MNYKKTYLNISEVAKLLDIKEHVIRHWDSLNPKTKKLRIEGLSFRRNSKSPRFFNKEHINKLRKLREILRENGKQNYSLDLASKIFLQDNNLKQSMRNENKKKFYDSSESYQKFSKISAIIKNLKKLI